MRERERDRDWFLPSIPTECSQIPSLRFFLLSSFFSPHTFTHFMSSLLGGKDEHPTSWTLHTVSRWDIPIEPPMALRFAAPHTERDETRLTSGQAVHLRFGRSICGINFSWKFSQCGSGCCWTCRTSRPVCRTCRPARASGSSILHSRSSNRTVCSREWTKERKEWN